MKIWKIVRYLLELDRLLMWWDRQDNQKKSQGSKHIQVP